MYAGILFFSFRTQCLTSIMTASHAHSADQMDSKDSLDEIEVRPSNEFIACKNLLDFEIPNDTPWRLSLPGELQGQLPSLKEMIEDIVQFQRLWKSAKCGLDPSDIKAAKQIMLVSFIHSVNVEEGIGTQELSDTEEIIKHIDEGDIGNARPHAQGISPYVCNHIMLRQMRKLLMKNVQETENLYNAWLELVQMAAEERNIDPTNCGLLEMKQCIIKIHKTLMTGVIDEKRMTAPGIFSTRERMTTFKGKEHQYPRKETQEEWESTISTLIDRYNGLIEAIKQDLVKQIDAHATSSLFKCAAWFLFNLVSLHPFSDGNGRLCRLLASYTLLLVTPFPSPIYNIFSDLKKGDYVDTIVRARDSQDHHPDHLTALLIESNWAAWQKFLKYLGINFF